MQFVDDVLDFTGSTLQLGKPALNDLKSGLATAPVLYAAEEHPELHALILRRFKCEGAALSPCSFCSVLDGDLRQEVDSISSKSHALLSALL